MLCCKVKLYVYCWADSTFKKNQCSRQNSLYLALCIAFMFKLSELRSQKCTEQILEMWQWCDSLYITFHLKIYQLSYKNDYNLYSQKQFVKKLPVKSKVLFIQLYFSINLSLLSLSQLCSKGAVFEKHLNADYEEICKVASFIESRIVACYLRMKLPNPALLHSYR